MDLARLIFQKERVMKKVLLVCIIVAALFSLAGWLEFMWGKEKLS